MLETVLRIGNAFRKSPTGLKHHCYIKQCPPDTDKKSILRLSLPVKINFSSASDEIKKISDFSFDFEGIKEIVDENVIRDKLFYLTFKTTGADNQVKYIFGDIYYAVIKGKEGGYYRVGDNTNKQKAQQVSSFCRGCKDFKVIEKIYENQSIGKGQLEVDIAKRKEKFIITLFRDAFQKNIELIERILKYQCGILEYLDLKRNGIIEPFIEFISDEKVIQKATAKRVFSNIKQSRTAKKILKELDIQEPEWTLIETSEPLIQKLINYSTSDLFLHFDFDGNHWYEFTNELNSITGKMLEDFAEKATNKKGYVLKKYIYKTLSSPSEDLQFPTFSAQARYRNRLFYSLEDISDLFYGIDSSKKTKIKIPYTDIKIIVLPKGDNLSAQNFEDFIYAEKYALNDEQKQESIIRAENSPNPDDLFAPLIENVAEGIIKFDLIFSKQGEQSSPDVDLIEISSVEKSHLRQINHRIEQIKQLLYSKRKNEINKDLEPLSISRSFLNILKDRTSDIKKYQSHIYKVLPQIYTGTYYNDAVLLPVFIEKTEANIRDGELKFDSFKFNLLKYDFYFLTSIQDVVPEGGNLMRIQESQSYKLGLFLGKLAEQFAAWKDDCPIKSFEKSYVGTLSRRISTIPDLIKFKTFIEEKLIIHEKNYKSIKDTAYELTQAIKDFSGPYNKNECAFGFFESYFSPLKKDNQVSMEEKIIR